MTVPTPSKHSLVIGSVLILVVLSGCMGLGGGDSTPNETETNNSSTLNITADSDGSSSDEQTNTNDSVTDTENPSTETVVNNTTDTDDGDNSTNDGGVGDFISELIGGEEEGNTTIDENETKVEFKRNYANNVSVFVTSVGPADHIYVVDSNNHEMYSTMSGSPSYSKSGISDDQFLVSGENGGAGTSVTIDVSGSGTVRVISVAGGREQTIATYDYDTESESG